MSFYERRLPHWDVIGQPVFITFRLHGSLPPNRIFPPARQTGGAAFLAMDRILDLGRGGPVFLRQPEIAGTVVQALLDGEARFERYQLHAFAVMPNHVHLLVTPKVSARQWLGPLKGFTGHRANAMIGRAGAFWQDESYDHLVRNAEQFRRIERYIEGNPVGAGLAATAEEYAWSSATPGKSPAAGRKA